MRSLATTIAVVALALGAARLEMRRRAFRDRAEGHASRARDYGVDRGLMGFREGLCEPGSSRLRPEAARRMDQLVAWARSLEAKYRRAAARPWESVEPDPPAPGP